MEMNSKLVTQVANMGEVKDWIIRLRGRNCEKYYISIFQAYLRSHY